jgi:signal transduction histidine kinase
MPSPKTEATPEPTTASRWERFDPRSTAALFRRLNVRLVLILSLVALIGLIVSGVAITQILPGYFAEQTQERIQTAADSTGILLRDQVNRVGETQPNVVMTAELRDTVVVPPVAEFAASAFNATVSIINEEGRAVITASPEDMDRLRAEGLRRDTDVEPARTGVPVPLPDGSQTAYLIVVSDPFTSRAETLDQIRGALLFGGWLALLVSLIAGIIAARGVTAPLSRLRGVARSLGHGQLDERAVPSGVLEIDELGHQFNVMADRLSGTLRMLEADRDRLREFVADVSHELRTPIAALRMYNELGSTEMDEATRTELHERSIEQIGRLEWLSTNLLDLSRIDAGIFPLDMQTGDLRDPVQAVVQALSEEALARGIGLDSVVPAHPVELRFDRERIVQLTTNLVGNALKFTPRAGGVSVQMEDRDDEVEILVRDTGPGIPADELPHIFERFYRGTNTGEARASGSGLGLAIARSIVDMHAGTIEVSSELGRGTEFRILLPRGHVEAEAVTEATKVNETSRGSRPARNPGTVA